MQLKHTVVLCILQAIPTQCLLDVNVSGITKINVTNNFIYRMSVRGDRKAIGRETLFTTITSRITGIYLVLHHAYSNCHGRPENIRRELAQNTTASLGHRKQ